MEYRINVAANDRSYLQAALPPRKQKELMAKSANTLKSKRVGLAWAKQTQRKKASGAFQLDDARRNTNKQSIAGLRTKLKATPGERSTIHVPITNRG